MNDRGGRGQLLRKYVVVFLLLVGGVLLVSSGIELYFSYQETKAALITIEREQAIAAAARIERFIQDIEQQLRWTTQAAFDDPTAAQEQREIDYLRLLRNVPAIAEISHLDASGKQLRVSRLNLDAIGSQEEYSRTPKFLNATAGNTYFSPVDFRNESEPYMTVAVPTGEHSIEVTFAEVDLKAIWDVVSRIRIGNAGSAYVVDSLGRLVAHPNISLVLQKRDLSALPQIRSARGPRSVAGDESVGMIADGLQGGQVLTAHARIETLGWFVFVEQPLGEAFAPLQKSIVRSVIAFALALVLSVLASVLLARRMVAPIRALQAGAARIGAGDLGHRIEVRTDDELQTLGDEFNRTAARLQESYASLEEKIEARTRDLRKALEKVSALSEISQAVSSTLDLPTVLTTIVDRAVQLSGSHGGIVYEFDEATQTFHARATYQITAEHLEAVRAAPIRLGEGAIGRAGVIREPVEVVDIADERQAVAPQTRSLLTREGLRSLLAVPLVRDERLLGGLVILRRERGSFSAEVIATLQTFATQSVLAIQNARLFVEIEDKSRQLETASRHKSEFLANMSHELRTPLNAILGFSEVLSERMFGEINEKQAEYLDDILGSGRHLLSLINDILDLSKIEAGRMDLETTEFDLPNAIEHTMILIRERAHRRAITLSSTIDTQLGSIRADERKVKQVLLNLLSNALKFTPEGGQITVRARLHNEEAEISVTDTGVGIAPEDQDAVFEEFRQVGTAARKVEGTGLGLAISRKFIELHGGRIWVKSQVGIGSTFAFTLPSPRSDV
jgi:signal transduction histidine kinase